MIEFVGKSIHLEDYTMKNRIYDETNGLWYERQGEMLCRFLMLGGWKLKCCR